MPYTSCKVHMEFVDVSASADSTVSSENNADIGNITLMKEKAEYPLYAVPDLNSFILDGSRQILSDTSKIPFISDQVSNTQCLFEENPMFSVEFTQQHTSVGIMLFFLEDYPAEITVIWYNLSGEKLASETYFPDGMKFFCRKQVPNYGKIEISFMRTRRPGQRIRCQYVKYGTEIDWTGENIKEASLTEEVDVTGATIPINTAEISIVDVANDFGLDNQSGIWKSIQKYQELTIVEEVMDKEVLCGTLYINTWQSDRNIVSFSLVDRIGMLDNTKFYHGKVYEDVLAGDIIDSIMDSAGVDDYYVAEEVRSIPITGYLPICTHREAIQQVIFACGAVTDCSRTGIIRIYMPDRYADSTIGIDRKFMGTKVEMDEYVSGVSISYSRYKLKDEAEEAFNDTLPAGESLIEFTDPYTELEASGGSMLDSGTNYVCILMAEAGECTICGKRYESNTITYTATVDRIEAGEVENIQSYSGCTLVNTVRVKEIAERLLRYYQLRQIVNLRYLLNTERTGEWVNIMDIHGNMVTSEIASQTIDLSGGFIADAVCRGYSVVTSSNAYTGEIFAGEREMI
ncbi:MAG: hypothetical protein J1E83_12605 [Lachnospiraceae bacterium]|nr:hypothetical protein [Lachnospiraceae bacterium]